MQIPLLTDIVAFLKIKGDEAFAFAVFCAILFAFAETGVLYFDTTPSWLRAALGAGALAGLVIWLLRTWRRVSLWWRESRERAAKDRQLQESRQKILRQLDSLTDEEKALIGHMLANNTTVATCDWKASAPGKLTTRGLLVRDESNMHPRMYWPHYIPEFVWNELQERRDEFLEAYRQYRRR